LERESKRWVRGWGGGMKNREDKTLYSCDGWSIIVCVGEALVDKNARGVAASLATSSKKSSQTLPQNMARKEGVWEGSGRATPKPTESALDNGHGRCS